MDAISLRNFTSIQSWLQFAVGGHDLILHRTSALEYLGFFS
jgi:hypothetical protein